MLDQVEESLAAALAEGRLRIEVGPFDLFIRRESAAEHLSMALPRRPTHNWDGAISPLIAAFRLHERRPRLEYIHERHPTLAAALVRAGFHEEMRAPVMTLAPAECRPPVPVAGTHVRRLSAAEPEALEQFLRRQSVAYGGDGGDDALEWLPLLREGLAAGSHFVTALVEQGEMRAGATIQGGGQAGEMAGVWTLPGHRRRGLARAACGPLLADFFAAGHRLCWLSAAEGALRLYETLGFTRAGNQLNFTLPG